MSESFRLHIVSGLQTSSCMLSRAHGFTYYSGPEMDQFSIGDPSSSWLPYSANRHKLYCSKAGDKQLLLSEATPLCFAILKVPRPRSIVGGT